MNLKEMNTEYDAYILTEEYYLKEGLKAFKKSKRLYKYAGKLEKALIKAESKKRISPMEISSLKALNKDVMKLADEYKVIEDEYAVGGVKKVVSKAKLKRIDMKNSNLIKKMKKAETKSAFKKIGLAALSVGLLAALWGTGSITGLGVIRSVGAVSSKQGVI